MKMRRLAALTLCAAVWLGMTGPAVAQGPGGALSGRVLDPSGSAVPGVTVTATHPATGDTRTTVTAMDGAYQIGALAIGSYTLTFQLEGFKTLTRTGILIEAAVPRTLNVTLHVGGISEVIQVDGGTPILTVTTPTVS
ncbi:MAG TPA: carboxypeptidase-like regulatory domain-containing protein, partial [Vicinamibacterales bacterium]